MTIRTLLRPLPFVLALLLTPALGTSPASAEDAYPKETAPACVKPDSASRASYAVGLKGAYHLETDFVLAKGVPTCAGATYTFTVESVPGAPALGWTGDGTVSPDGRVVTLTFVGTGELVSPLTAVKFSLRGTTDKKYVRGAAALDGTASVRLSMTTTLSTATGPVSYTWSSPNGEIDEDAGGGGSYYG